MTVTTHETWPFYLTLRCPRCEASIVSGRCWVTSRHRDLPAVPISIGADNMYDCSSCNGVIVVGSLPVWMEDEMANEMDRDL